MPMLKQFFWTSCILYRFYIQGIVVWRLIAFNAMWGMGINYIYYSFINSVAYLERTKKFIETWRAHFLFLFLCSWQTTQQLKTQSSDNSLTARNKFSWQKTMSIAWPSETVAVLESPVQTGSYSIALQTNCVYIEG